MKILFISNSGECLPIISRMKKDVEDIIVYIHNPSYKKNYNGMGINKVSLSKLKNTVKGVDIIIFDINKTNDNTKEDRALLKIFKCPLKSSTLFGPVSDKIKQLYKDKKVIGCSTFTEELEMDRKKGSDYAKKLGFSIPETWEFDNLKEGIEFLKKNKDLWVIKLDDNKDLDLTYVEKFQGELLQKMSNEYMTRVGDKVEYILQKKIDGVEVSNEMWFNGSEWVNGNRTIENKKLMNGNLGLSIGSQSNTVWFPDQFPLKPMFDKMIPDLKQAKYKGPIDVNTIFKNGKYYFLEWTNRFGYDALYCLLTLLKGKITDFFVNDFKGNFHKEFACSQRITIPPFPYNVKSLLKNMARDVSIEGVTNNMFLEDIYFNNGIRCSAADGIIGVVVMRNKDLNTAWNSVYKEINKLKIGSDLQFRTDGYNQSFKRFKKLEE